MESEQIIYGRNPVLEALLSDSGVDTIFIAKNASGFGKIIAAAKEKGVVIKEASDEKLRAILKNNNIPDANIQGVIAFVSSVEYASLSEILSVSATKGKPPFIIIADEIEDPHNLGALIRTAEACGADGVIIPKRRSAAVNATVMKTSAGAASWIKIARVSNLVDTIKELKKQNVWVYGAEADGTNYRKANLSGGTALVIGSEGTGLGRLVRESCDMVLSIDMYGKVNSLNASVSGAILMYEIVRSRES